MGPVLPRRDRPIGLTNLIAPGVFALFIAGVALVALARRLGIRDERHKTVVSFFVLYVVVMSCGASFAQRDLYPFAAWSLLPRWVGPTWSAVRIVGVDAAGLEHPIDARAWEPLSGDELRTWFQLSFLQLDSATRDRVAAFLLEQVDARRRAAASGAPVGRYARIFGPLRAPLTVIHPEPWSVADSVPPPFVALRYYRDRWGLVQRARDGDRAVRRQLLYEYRRR